MVSCWKCLWKIHCDCCQWMPSRCFVDFTVRKIEIHINKTEKRPGEGGRKTKFAAKSRVDLPQSAYSTHAILCLKTNFTIKHENLCGWIITLHACEWEFLNEKIKKKTKFLLIQSRYTDNAKMVNHYIRYVLAISKQRTTKCVSYRKKTTYFGFNWNKKQIKRKRKWNMRKYVSNHLTNYNSRIDADVYWKKNFINQNTKHTSST